MEAADTQGKGRCLWPRGVRKHGAKDGAERVHKGIRHTRGTHTGHRQRLSEAAGTHMGHRGGRLCFCMASYCRAVAKKLCFRSSRRNMAKAAGSFTSEESLVASTVTIPRACRAERM